MEKHLPAVPTDGRGGLGGLRRRRGSDTRPAICWRMSGGWGGWGGGFRDRSGEDEDADLQAALRQSLEESTNTSSGRGRAGRAHAEIVEDDVICVGEESADAGRRSAQWFGGRECRQGGEGGREQEGRRKKKRTRAGRDGEGRGERGVGPVVLLDSDEESDAETASVENGDWRGGFGRGKRRRSASGKGGTKEGGSGAEQVGTGVRTGSGRNEGRGFSADTRGRRSGGMFGGGGRSDFDGGWEAPQERGAFWADQDPDGQEARGDGARVSGGDIARHWEESSKAYRESLALDQVSCQLREEAVSAAFFIVCDAFVLADDF